MIVDSFSTAMPLLKMSTANFVVRKFEPCFSLPEKEGHVSIRELQVVLSPKSTQFEALSYAGVARQSRNGSRAMDFSFLPCIYARHKAKCSVPIWSDCQYPYAWGTNTNDGTVRTYGDDNLTAYLTSTLPRAPQRYSNEMASACPIGSPGIASVSQQSVAIFTEFVVQRPQARELRDFQKRRNSELEVSQPNSSPTPLFSPF